MKLKKLSAFFGLLSILLILLHVGYSIYAYLTFYYNPFLQKVFAVPFMVTVCLHAVCGMIILFTKPDGIRADLYPGLNRRTIVQRISAVLIFPLLLLHINTFSMMKNSAENSRPVFVVLLMIGEVIFYGTVLTHVAVSFSNGFVTLGILSSQKTRKVMDTAVCIFCGICFAAASYIILKGQAAMFLSGGAQ